MMTRDELLARLETMTHAERVRAMIALGRRGDEESRAVVSALASGDFYERMLALYSCFGSRDRDLVARALGDPSRIIRGLALRLAAQVCDANQIRAALDSARVRTRLALLWRLRRSGRQDDIDAYIDRAAASGDAALPRLLAFGSPTLASRFGDQVVQLAVPRDWEALAHAHPSVALALLERWAGDAAPNDARFTPCVATAVPVLARRDPERTLALIGALRRVLPLSAIPLQELATRRASAVADLVLTEPEGMLFDFAPFVRRLRAEQVIALWLHTSTRPYPPGWFPRLAPESRGAVYAALAPQLRTPGEPLPPSLVAALPRTERESVARTSVRMSSLSLTDQIAYATYLPWDEIMPALAPHLRSSTVATRQSALRALIAATAFHRDHLPEVLEELRGRRTEHDSVRAAMFRALVQLPPGMWRADELPALADIIRHGLNDVGLSPSTRQSIVTLLFKVLPFHASWSAGQLATLLRERGWTTPRSAPVYLPPAALADLTRVLLPLFATWMEHERETDVLAAIECLPWRGPGLAPLLPMLDELLRRTRDRDTAKRALRLLGARAPEHLRGAIPVLLGDDPSWITFGAVSDSLLRQRQDLLAQFLAFQPYAGRWDAGRNRFLMPLSGLFAAGTTRQQEAYAAAALDVISDSTQTSYVVTRAVKSLALLPGIAADRLADLAHDERSVVRTTALFALAHLDTDHGMPTLLAALQDRRARIAILVVRPFLLAMPPARALEIVRAIPRDRVTLAKEVVRLIGAIGGDEAYADLLALDARELHRDVRAALLRTLAHRLDREETWAALERAAVSPEAVIALAAVPTRTPDPDARQRVLGIIATLLRHPDASVRITALGYCARLAVPDSEGVFVPLLVEMTRAPTVKEADAAVDALFAVVAEPDLPTISSVIRAMLPDRRRLQSTVKKLHWIGASDESRVLALVRDVLAVLAEDPMTATLRVDLAVAHLPTSDLIAFYGQMAERNELHADALTQACQTLAGDKWRMGPLVTSDLQVLETTLAASPDERLRRIAFAALCGQTQREDTWSDQQFARLRAFRADPSPLVATVAQFTFAPQESEDEDDGEEDEEVDEDEDERDGKMS